MAIATYYSPALLIFPVGTLLMAVAMIVVDGIKTGKEPKPWQ